MRMFKYAKKGANIKVIVIIVFTLLIVVLMYLLFVKGLLKNVT